MPHQKNSKDTEKGDTSLLWIGGLNGADTSLIEPEKCDGCNECIEACEKVLGKSALFLNKMDSGYHAIVCQQCIDPSCARGCFRDAIKRENGTVSIDQESCVGCKLCMLMCPIGAITYTEDGMVKCDQQCIRTPATPLHVWLHVKRGPPLKPWTSWTM